MPFKHDADRRHRIPQARYRVRNWREYEAGPKRRGDLTLWVDAAALAGWQAPRPTTPGGQARYSDAAIELVLILRLVFHLALRRAEGFARSVLRLLGQDLRVPDHTTLSRRSRISADRRPRVVPHGPMHLVIDSTGLKLFGRGEWDAEKHGRARRSWRKLRLAVDADTGEIVAGVLTDNGADDAGELPALLGQTEGEIASVTADGAYDGEPVYRAIAGRQPDPPPDVVVVPPRASAVPGARDADARSQRDRHVRPIAEKGRMACQRATAYGRRSLAETAVGRHKVIAGPKLRARSLPAQQGEIAIAVDVLNRMIAEGAFADPKPDVVFGLHMVSGLPAGTLGYRPGPAHASADEFRITVTGRQTHGARPWSGVDPIVIGAQIVSALQTIQSRQVNVDEPSVLTVGQFHAGTRNNIIPDRAEMNGTLRTYDEARRAYMQRRVNEIAENVAKGMDGSATVHWEPNGYPVTINDPALTERMLPSLARVAGEGRLRLSPRSTAGEDFSYFAREAPGLFFWVGIAPPGADPAHVAPNHSPRFRVDEVGLLAGLRATLHLVADFTGSGSAA